LIVKTKKKKKKKEKKVVRSFVRSVPREKKTNNCGLSFVLRRRLAAASAASADDDAKKTDNLPPKSKRFSLSRLCECALARASSPALSPRPLKLSPR